MATSLDTAADGGPHLEELAAHGTHLLESLSSVLERLPGRPARQQELARALGINKNLSSRLLSALREREVLGAIHQLPGTAPLRQVLDGASGLGVDGSTVAAAREAVESFDLFVREEFGTRAALQGLLSPHVPGAREQLQATSKQAIFRGRAGLRGIEVDALVVTFLVHPSSDDPSSCDTTVVNSHFGVRRTRPDAQFSFTTWLENRGSGAGGTRGSILHEFCTPTPLPLETAPDGDVVRHTLAGDSLGRRHVHDVVTTERYFANHPLDPVAAGKRWPRWFFAGVEHPVKLLVLDVLLHRDVWPDAEAELLVYDAAHGRVIEPGDPARESDRLHLLEGLEHTPAGRALPRPSQVPRYGEVLARVCGDHGWRAEEFRAYTVESPYPPYAAQYSVLFRPPGQGSI